jgi:TolA-binding protein
LFIAGKYAEAQTQFQKYLDAFPDSDFTAQASLGIAASLEAQGKIDLATVAYQKAINQSAPVSVAVNAKFALARIAQQQGKIADAEKLYEDIAKQNQGSPYAQEAAMRAMELRTGSVAPAVQTSTAAMTNSPAPSFQLTH